MSSNISRSEDHSAYHKGDESYPPVSDILSYLDEDKTGLEYWRKTNDGTGDAAHHPHLFWFSRHRGTLAHYEALNPLAEDDLWGYEESQSMTRVLTGPSAKEIAEMFAPNAASTMMADIVYSVMRNHEERYPIVRSEYEAKRDLSSILADDIAFFTDTFDFLCDELGINDDSVLAVEAYLVDDCHRFGGQADLLYRNPDGETVLADLKTSSSLRQKHRLQTAAYRHGAETCDAVPVDSVDRMEVIRINPDKENYTVYSNDKPEHVGDADWYDTEQFLVDKYGEFAYENADELFAHFESLAKQANTNWGDE